MAFWRNYAHLIWATKYREPLIRPEIEAQLYACIVRKAADLGCYVHAINGIADHVHVIISIPPKHSVAWVVKNLKGNSSHFVNHVLTPDKSFAWQRGYGCLSLGESQCERAIAYVANQKAHHSAGTTNNWLERADDEGEDGDGRRAVSQGEVLREPGAAYDLSADLPF